MSYRETPVRDFLVRPVAPRTMAGCVALSASWSGTVNDVQPQVTSLVAYNIK